MCSRTPRWAKRTAGNGRTRLKALRKAPKCAATEDQPPANLEEAAQEEEPENEELLEILNLCGVSDMSMSILMAKNFDAESLLMCDAGDLDEIGVHARDAAKLLYWTWRTLGERLAAATAAAAAVTPTQPHSAAPKAVRRRPGLAQGQPRPSTLGGGGD